MTDPIDRIGNSCRGGGKNKMFCVTAKMFLSDAELVYLIVEIEWINNWLMCFNLYNIGHKGNVYYIELECRRNIEFTLDILYSTTNC